LPYIRIKRKELKLQANQHALLIFDKFKVQCTEKLLTRVDAHDVYAVMIPANCTDRLQPLDISVNKLDNTTVSAARGILIAQPLAHQSWM